MRNFLFVSFFFLVLAGCDKPMPNPESIDPIYNDLNSQLASAKSALSSQQDSLKSAQSDLQNAVPQTGDRERARSQIYKYEHQVTMTEQQIKYLEIRTKERLKDDRVNYLKAFFKKKKWPDPEEWQEYETHRQLVTADRTWKPKIKNPIPFLSQDSTPPPSDAKKDDNKE